MAARKPAAGAPGSTFEVQPGAPLPVIIPGTQLSQLAAEFPGSALKGRSQGGKTLTYVSIDATINRLNAVLGSAWSIDRAETTVDPAAGTAVCQLFLTATIDGLQKTAYGVGFDKATDLDKAAKTALAEALKKACHQFGIALYLWDEDARARAEGRMKLDKARDSEATLKRAVFELAKQKNDGAAPDGAAGVAKILGVPVGDLSDKAKLVAILEAEGVL